MIPMKSTARGALALAVIFLFTLAVYAAPTGAAVHSPRNYEKAVDLKILGLFANSPENFELDRAPTRVEGAVMLVRLLGKENQALQKAWSHPFTDVPKWADRHIGYLYQHNLTKGVGGGKFAPADLMTAKQYVTLSCVPWAIRIMWTSNTKKRWIWRKRSVS